MKGQLRQRAGGSWSLVLYLGRDPLTGKKRYKWHTFHGNKREAQRELNRLLAELDTGGYVDPAKLTVGEYLQRWLDDYARPNVSGKTCERYAEIVNRHLIPALGRTLLAQLKPTQVQAYYRHALERGRLDGKGGLSAQTVHHHHSLLRKALHQAVRWQLLARSPLESVDPPRVERSERPTLTTEETLLLLETAEGGALYLPILIAVTTGLRRGEVLALRWEDLSPKTGTLSIRQSLEETKGSLRFKAPKTAKSRRLVDLPEFVVEELRQHRESQARDRALVEDQYQDFGLIMARWDGSPCRPDWLSHAFARVIQRAGVPRVCFHDLRHTHATQLLEQGVHAKVVSERLGHANISITLDTYSHVIPGMGREAARRIHDALSGGRRGAVHGDAAGENSGPENSKRIAKPSRATKKSCTSDYD